MRKFLIVGFALATLSGAGANAQAKSVPWPFPRPSPLLPKPDSTPKVTARSRLIDGMEAEAEAGLAVATGNTDSETYNLKQSLSYEQDGNTYKQNSRLFYGKTSGIPTASSWLFTLRYERLILGKVSAFAAETAEGDRFAGQDPKWSTDLGGKYEFLDSRESQLSTETGYRYSRIRYFTEARTRDYHYGRFFFEGGHALSPTVWAKASIEFLHNFTDNSQWQLSGDASLSVFLNEIFSLKTSYSLKYDHSPAIGKRRKDTLLTAALVAKF